MATSTIKYDGDTSWNSGTDTWNTPVKYRVRNGICTITAKYGGEFSIDSTERQVLTLPTEYRPTEDVYFPIVNRATANGSAFGHIYTDGKLTITATTTTSYFAFGVSYPVK